MVRDIVTNRQRAYGYIKHLFEDVDWCTDSRDEHLAFHLSVPLADLLALKDGESGPSEAVVQAVKDYFKGYPDPLIPTEIEQILVEPFIDKAKRQTPK